jgi:hypothetical protein
MANGFIAPQSLPLKVEVDWLVHSNGLVFSPAWIKPAK